MSSALGFNFIPLPATVIGRDLTRTELRLLILLCSKLKLGQEPEWRFSMSDLGSLTGSSINPVREAITSMEGRGWISRSASAGPSGFLYRLRVEAFEEGGSNSDPRGDQILEGGSNSDPPCELDANKDRAQAHGIQDQDPDQEKNKEDLPASPKSWSAEACDDWTARTAGTAPGGMIGKWLKPIVDACTWAEVRPAWQLYLAENDVQYLSPQRFSTTYGKWAELAEHDLRRMQPPKKRASPADKEALTAVLRRLVDPDSELTKAWESVIAILRERLNPGTFETWFKPTEPIGVDEDGAFCVGVPNELFVRWLHATYGDELSRAFPCKIRFIVDERGL